MYFSVHYVPMHSCSIMTMSELVPEEEVDPKTLGNLPNIAKPHFKGPSLSIDEK